MLCELADVSRSGYYRWLGRADAPDKDYRDYLKIKEVFDTGRGKYGWRSLKMRLASMNHKKIQRIMRKYSLVATVRKKNPYKAIMKKRMEHRVFPNKLQRNFQQSRPYAVFCTDITYLPFQERFAYVSVVKDIASGEVVAWNASLNLDMALVTDTMKRLPDQKCQDALIHSDQGFHYTSPAFSGIVRERRMTQSMSGKGNCIDNAPIESFFGHLKDELDYRSCPTFDALQLKITEYMRYYNHERRQWTRQRMTPVAYRHHLLAQARRARVAGL